MWNDKFFVKQEKFLRCETEDARLGLNQENRLTLPKVASKWKMFWKEIHLPLYFDTLFGNLVPQHCWILINVLRMWTWEICSPVSRNIKTLFPVNYYWQTATSHNLFCNHETIHQDVNDMDMKVCICSDIIRLLKIMVELSWVTLYNEHHLTN